MPFEGKKLAFEGKKLAFTMRKTNNINASSAPTNITNICTNKITKGISPVHKFTIILR